MMNWIFLGLIVISALVAAFTGNMKPLTLEVFNSAKYAVMNLALPLVGIMAFFIGLMRVAQDAGLMRVINRVLRRPMRWLFPDIPPDHPAMSAMVLNFGANMLGLANAATPFGIKAMIELDKLNRHKGIATDAMCLFLAINTSSLALLPTGTMGLRAVNGSTDPASIWLPTLLTTTFSTIVGILVVKWLQRLRRYRIDPKELESLPEQPSEESGDATTEGGDAPQEPPDVLGSAERAGWSKRAIGWVFLVGFLGAAVLYYLFEATELGSARYLVEDFLASWVLPLPSFTGLPMLHDALVADHLGFWSVLKDFFSNWAIPALICGILLYGLSKRVRMYESLVEGAKEGFRVAVRIIPYLVAIIVAVGMFRASGAMDLVKDSIGRFTAWLGMPAEAIPMAIIRPLSGNGAFGYMTTVFSDPAHGPDSFLGQMVSVMQGSTETTLYVLAVYFGAVQVYRVRHALAAGLTADLAGIIAAVALSHVFF